MIKKGDLEKISHQYIYMIQGLEIKNKLRGLEGHDPIKIKQNLYEQIFLFIQGLKK